jgi:hypothetical protein
MIVSILEETMLAPKIYILKVITYSNNVRILAQKLARQILKFLKILTYRLL